MVLLLWYSGIFTYIYLGTHLPCFDFYFYLLPIWSRCYLLCSQPNDISVVVLYVYKNHKRRLKNDETSTISLSTFLGLETGFELKKQNNTMCVITQRDILTVAFQAAEILTMWETWIYHTCSKGSLFYAQLVSAPETSRAYSSLNCEVRLHIHDGRIGLVNGYPQRLIGFWFLNEIIRVCFNDNKLQFFANDTSGLDDGSYSLVCGRIQLLEKHYKLANKPGLLAAFLKQKEGDGLWYGDKSADFSQTLIRHSTSPVPAAGASASYVNVLTDSRFLPLSSAPSMASCCVPYVNDMGEECLHSQSEPSVSSVGHWEKSADVLLGSSTRDPNNLVFSSRSSKSLSRADSWPRPLTEEMIRGRAMSVRTRKWYAVNGREIKGRFVKQEKKASIGNKHYDCGTSRGQSRSLGMESRHLSSSREKNWNRAKRIIGGVRKSINDLNACKFSASLDKLALPVVLHNETAALASSSADDTNQIERVIPDGLQEPEFINQGFASSSTQSVNRLPGLIKLPPKKFSLIRARHILTKSLQKSISGSFSKYDGERSANHFNLEDAKCTGPVVDSIESAVKKGRARLLEAERRNSGFADRASPTNLPSHSIRTALPEKIAPSTCAAAVSAHGTDSSSCGRKSSLTNIVPTVDECYNAVSLFSMIPVRQPVKKSESLSIPSSRTELLPLVKGPPRTGSMRNFSTTVKEASIEKLQPTSLYSLSGSYCNLETKSNRNLLQKSAEVSRTVYVQIDPVATLGATQTMMRDRARVGNLIKNKRFSSQNNVESKDRSDEGWSKSGFFARRLWRKLPMSRSYSDLRF
uniref:IRS-type PTB domain-containing protein n=1 Tax=Setaria digitata TaxID=48799 RepID=A0A915PYX9_9BILA